MNDLFTVNELAAGLKVTPSTVRTWIHRGVIPAMRLTPKVVRIDLDKVVEAMRDSAIGGTMKNNTPKPALLLTETDDRQSRMALGVSERLLWTKTTAHEIPHCRINRTIVYPVHLLQEWLAAQAKGGDARHH